MWKEIAATETPKTAAPAKKWREDFEAKHLSVKAGAKPVTEDELRAIFDRLDAARDIFRQNRELREVCPASTPRPGNCGAAMRSWKR